MDIELNDQLVKLGFDSDKNRIRLAWAMAPAVEEIIIANSVSRMVLERLTKDPHVEVRYDINTVCLPSHGAVPERGPGFATFYEIVSYVTHTEKLKTVADALPILTEAGWQIRCQEESNFFAMANLTMNKFSTKTLTQAVNDLVEKGADTIAICAAQDDSHNYDGIKYRYEDNHKLKNEIDIFSKRYPNLTIIPTLSVTENQVYGFKGKVGQLWIQQNLEVIPADEMSRDGETVDTYGYVFSEIISAGITKPDLVFKVCLE